VGSGVATSPFSIRWNEVSRIGLAWVIMLPLSIVLAAALATVGRLIH
jgi:phosphate/sulfate permease